MEKEGFFQTAFPSPPVGEVASNSVPVVIPVERDGDLEKPKIVLEHYYEFYSALRFDYFPKVIDYIENRKNMIEIKDRKGNSPLLLAARCKLFRIVKYLIESGANLNVINNYGQNILHYTVRNKKYTEITQFIIENMNSDNELQIFQSKEKYHKKTALHFALYHQPSNISLVKLFIKDKYKELLNIQDVYGFTPAHIAIQQNCSLEMFEYLLENGAQFNIPSNNNIYPLISAIKNSNFEIVKRILELFPDLIEINPIATTKQPIQCAARKSSKMIIKYLCERGSKVDIENSFYPPLAYLCSNEMHLNIDDLYDLILYFINLGADVKRRYGINRDMLLHNFRIVSNEKLTDLLIKNGLSFDVKNDKGFTPIFTLVAERRSVKTFQLLLPHYINAVDDKDVNGMTLLHHACLRVPDWIIFQEEIVKSLIDHKFDVNAIDNRGRTPLHCLFDFATNKTMKGVNISSLKELIKNGANVNKQDVNGCTPLLLLCEKIADGIQSDDYLKCLQILLDASADPNIPDLYSVYPIHLISQRYLNTLQLLVEYGAKINVISGLPQVDNNNYQSRSHLLSGFNPLFVPAMNGAYDVVEYLLERNCDVNVKSSMHSRNVLHFVCENIKQNRGREEKSIAILKTLLKHHVDVNGQDDKGDTPLIIVCRIASESYSKRIANSGRGGLLGMIASIMSGINTLDPDYSLRFISTLIEGGANVNVENKENESALSLSPKFPQLFDLLSRYS